MSQIVEALGADFFRRALAEAILVGGLGGILSVHVLMRRLPFLVAAISHAVFPGVVVASLVGVSALLGGAVAGLGFAACVTVIGRGGNEHQSVSGGDHASAVGVSLAGAFALGVVLLNAQGRGSGQITNFLVGSIVTVAVSEVILTAVIALVAVVVLAAFRKELVLAAFDRDAANALGYRPVLLDFAVLGLIAVTVTVALPAVGTLLVVALLTAPAMTARLWTSRIATLTPVAAVLGACAGGAGMIASACWNLAAGPAIALAAVSGFAVSLVATSLRRRLFGS